MCVLAAGLQQPAQRHEVLRSLLARMWDGRKHESVRIPLAGALLNYLQLCRGPSFLQLPPSALIGVTLVFPALLAGAAAGVVWRPAGPQRWPPSPDRRY